MKKILSLCLLILSFTAKASGPVVVQKQGVAASTGSVIAAAYFANTGSCTWSRTNTSAGPFNTTAACPAITVDYVQGCAVNNTDTDLPQINFTYLPPGVYEVTASFMATAGTSANFYGFTLSDGFVNKGNQANYFGTSDMRIPFTLVGIFPHAGGPRSYSVYCSASASSCQIENDAGGTKLNFLVRKIN